MIVFIDRFGCVLVEQCAAWRPGVLARSGACCSAPCGAYICDHEAKSSSVYVLIWLLILALLFRQPP